MSLLWKCPKCGIEGRLGHRYLSPDKGPPEVNGRMNPGACPMGFLLEYTLARQAARRRLVQSIVDSI